jgi:hypothetical protein
MYVHWRKREHEAAYEAVAADPAVMATLTQFGLVKFFLSPFMHAQPRLLNALVEYWHPDAEAFMIEGQYLTPTTEDIYFLTGLSRRGETVNLHTFPTGERKVSELIAEYCVAGPTPGLSGYQLTASSTSHCRPSYLLLGGLPVLPPIIRLRAHI